MLNKNYNAGKRNHIYTSEKHTNNTQDYNSIQDC